MSTTANGSGDTASMGWALLNTAAGLPAVPFAHVFNYTPTQYTSGTGAGQIDTIYATVLTIAAGATATITLSSFNDYFGNAASMKRWRGMMVGLFSPGQIDGPASGGVQASSVTVNPAGATHPLVHANGTALTGQVKSGGDLFDRSGGDAAGHPITAGTSDVLTIRNDDGVNAATVAVAVVGVSV